MSFTQLGNVAVYCSNCFCGLYTNCFSRGSSFHDILLLLYLLVFAVLLSLSHNINKTTIHIKEKGGNNTFFPFLLIIALCLMLSALFYYVMEVVTIMFAQGYQRNNLFVN